MAGRQSAAPAMAMTGGRSPSSSANSKGMSAPTTAEAGDTIATMLLAMPP